MNRERRIELLANLGNLLRLAKEDYHGAAVPHGPAYQKALRSLAELQADAEETEEG